MFDWIGTLFRTIGSGFVWWTEVQPWQQGLRTRLGKWVRRLEPGPHFKIPFLDKVITMGTAWRTAMIHAQTLSTSDGHTLVTGGTVGYVIDDIETMYRKLYHAEDTISQVAAAAIANVVQATPKASITPVMVAETAAAAVKGRLQDYGIKDIEFRLTDFAFIKAYRLIQEGRYMTGMPLTAGRGGY